MTQILDDLKEFIKEQPFYERVAKGDVSYACKGFSNDLGYAIENNKDRFPGLSILMVSNQAFTDHGWLLYHHPDAGFGIIDPTAGQFLQTPLGSKKEYKQYKDVFIGTREQLGKLAEEYGVPHWQRYWTPSMIVHQVSRGQRPQIFDREFKEVWDRHPITIDRIQLSDPIDRMARVAARYEEAGLDWRKAYVQEAKDSMWKKVEDVKADIEKAEVRIERFRRPAGLSF